MAELAAHYDTIYRYVFSIAGDSGEAEDLTQQTFLRAHDKLSGLQNPDKLLPWLYRIATNTCYDRFRQAAYRHRAQPLEDQASSVTESEPPDANAPRLTKLMEQDEMSACVQKYLVDLPDQFRAVMLLHDVEGVTNPEIARMLEISLATVKIRLHRARDRLRKALNEACSFRTDERGVVVCEPKPIDIKL